MYIVLAILGIGLLIALHEYGHYVACRLTRTRTETFSVGFGPRLFGWESAPGTPRRFTVGRRTLDPRTKAMDFRVALIPLGGFVKMAGENPGDKSGEPDEFGSKSIGQRALIAVAGVAMNALLAVAFYFTAYAAGLELEPPVAGQVTPGGPAWVAGLEVGDRVSSLDGETTRTFKDLRIEAALLPRGKSVPMVVQRGGIERVLEVAVGTEGELGQLLQVAPPGALTVTQAERSVTIGPLDEARVAGNAVRGGMEARAALVSAVSAGLERIEIERAGTPPFVLDLAAASVDPEKAKKRLGIEQRQRFAVLATRPPAAGRLQRGDRLLSAVVDGTSREIDTAGALDALRHLAEGSRLDSLTVEREGKPLAVDLALDPRDATVFLAAAGLSPKDEKGMAPVAAPRRHLVDGDRIRRYDRWAAIEAGMATGDRIVKVGDEEVKDVARVAAILDDAGRGPLSIEVEGLDGARRTLTATPASLAALAGVSLEMEILREPVAHGIGDAALLAVGGTGREVVSVFRQIGALFSGRIAFDKSVAGPITLVSMSGQAAENSWLHLLWFLAFISVTLAVLNVLPIPLLDGGHLLYLLIEKLKGSPLKEATIAKLQWIGLILLLTLMVFALKNDFASL